MPSPPSVGSPMSTGLNIRWKTALLSDWKESRRGGTLVRTSARMHGASTGPHRVRIRVDAETRRTTGRSDFEERQISELMVASGLEKPSRPLDLEV